MLTYKQQNDIINLNNINIKIKNFKTRKIKDGAFNSEVPFYICFKNNRLKMNWFKISNNRNYTLFHIK